MVFFIAVGCVLSFLWQLKVSIGLYIMGKGKISLYYYLTVSFFIKFYGNVFFFFSIVAMASERLKC